MKRKNPTATGATAGPTAGIQSSPIRTERFYEAFLDSLGSGLLALDKKGVVITANRAAAAHLGVSEADLEVGKPLSALACARPFLKALGDVIDQGQSIQRRDATVSLDGGLQKEIGFSAYAMKGPVNVEGAIFVFTDMTERRKLERAAELDRQLASLGELTAGVVHELRNPLSVISGMAELLMRQTDLDDRRHKNAAIILNETRACERFINDFLSLANPYDLEPKPVQPRAILERVLTLCQVRAQARNISIAPRCEEDAPMVWADLDKMSRAIANIVMNAVEASPDGGGVTLGVRQEGSTLLFEVVDQGPGIHLERGENLFTPFFSKKEGGTGLGLSIAHRIVTAHRGAINYSNPAEGGARFSVRLPIEPRE